MKTRHLILGVAFWLVVAGTGWIVLRSELVAQSSSISSMSADVARWISGQQKTLEAVSETEVKIAVGDPIFLASPDGTYRQVGLTVNLDGTHGRDPRRTKRLEVVIQDAALQSFADGFELEYHTTPTSLDWVVRTMIPRTRQKEIAGYISSEWLVHQQEIMAQLRPVIKDGVRTAMKAVEAELPEIVKSHREDFRQLGDRYETEILKAEVLPLVKAEILPIVEAEAAPVAEEVGRALWKRVSLWSFAWRYLYDSSPLPRRDAVKVEFQRFVDEVALPELRSRSDQFIKVTETIVKRSMENPKVKDVMRRNLKRVAEDPEMHRLIWQIVREAVVENDVLRTELETHLKEQETKSAIHLAGERLEPMVRKIGDMIFGSREQGITPEFSRVLRSQILQKDLRWLVMVPRGTVSLPQGQIRVITTAQPMIYPLGFGGDQQSPLTPVQD